MDNEIRETLKDIFSYIGVDMEYANNATVIKYVERLLDKNARKVFPTIDKTLKNITSK